MKKIIIIILILSGYLPIHASVTYLKISPSSIEMGEYEESLKRIKQQTVALEDTDKIITELQDDKELKVLYSLFLWKFSTLS